MEPTHTPLRYILILGKHPVTEVSPGFATIEIGNKVYIRFDIPPNTDIKRGDLLTLYTEVLSNAKPSEPPIQ